MVVVDALKHASVVSAANMHVIGIAAAARTVRVPVLLPLPLPWPTRLPVRV